MIKAKGTVNGKPTFFIGLSFNNLDEFKKDPNNTFIKIDKERYGLSHDLYIFSCETETEGVKIMLSGIDKDTKFSDMRS